MSYVPDTNSIIITLSSEVLIDSKDDSLKWHLFRVIFTIIKQDHQLRYDIMVGDHKATIYMYINKSLRSMVNKWINKNSSYGKVCEDSNHCDLCQYKQQLHNHFKYLVYKINKK